MGAYTEKKESKKKSGNLVKEQNNTQSLNSTKSFIQQTNLNYKITC